jgi:hypothetical protein
MSETRVFISYSHENDIWLQEWLDKKQTERNPRYLLGLWERTVRNQQVAFWYDRDEESGLRGGDRWQTRILEEIDRADVAVLLVTQDFIVSSFIRDVELPRMLERAKHGDLEILPILLEPARWKDLEIHGLFQLTPGSPTPLSEYFESSDHQWKKARLEVLEALERTLERVREKKNPRAPGITQPAEKMAPVIEQTRAKGEGGYKLPATLREFLGRLSPENAKSDPTPSLPNTPESQKPESGPSGGDRLMRLAAAAGLIVTVADMLRLPPPKVEVPNTFDPLLKVGPSTAEPLQLARQMYDGVEFGKLSSGERETVNLRLRAIIGSMGSAMKEMADTIPEADYLMVLVFMLDMERISKMGSVIERRAVLDAFPGKIEEYLTKYLQRDPNGKFAAKAKEFLKPLAG